MNDDDGTHITQYNEYINNDSHNKNIIAYYYKVTGTEDEITKNKIKESLVGENNILQPGDIFIFRRGAANSGHSILYVGDAIESIGGFVHSGGSDYKFTTDPEKISYGIDDYSVKYDDISYIERAVFNEATSTENSLFAIVRPINNYCTGDSCEISICDNPDCGIGYLNNNVKARVDLDELKVEQFAKIEKNFTDSSINGTQNIDKNLSKYNSVNVGDNITYALFLRNKSKMNYCSSGFYDTESACVSKGYEWRQKSTTGKVYDDLVITGKIPENTVFAGCTRDCKCDTDPCDERSKEVTWIINKENSFSKEITYRYTVKVVSETDITNEGIQIKTENDNVLQLSPITTKINPTINGLNIGTIKKDVDKFKTLLENGKITFNSEAEESYKTKLDNVTSTDISNFGFIKMLYYNSLEIDLGFLNAENIKEAIFNDDKYDDGFYTKKTKEDINILTDQKSININNMLVTGMYGGRLLKGNENKDRAQYLRADNLEFGDILVFFDENASKIYTAMYYGLDKDDPSIFMSFEDNNELILYDKNNVKTGATFFKEIYKKDLFVVLRPTQLYGTTIQYDYNSGKELDNSYVAYNTYKNLIIPEKDDVILKLEYNKNIDNYEKQYAISNSFSGWYNDKNYTTKLTETTNLISNNTHKIYAKWESEQIELPNPSFEGYTFNGWYSDSNLTKKVANGGDKYKTVEDTTLYAKWTETKYTITYELNGGTHQNHVTEYTIETDTFNLTTPIKTGHIFEGWYDNANYNGNKIIKIEKGSSGNKILYAKWKKIEELLEGLDIKDNYINIKEKTIVNNLGLKEGYNVKTYRNNKIMTTGNYGTGDKVEIYINSEKIGEYISVVKGDTTGDGTVNIADVAKTYQYLKNKITMTKEYEMAGNVVEIDEVIKINDVSKLYQYIKNKITILD